MFFCGDEIMFTNLKYYEKHENISVNMRSYNILYLLSSFGLGSSFIIFPMPHFSVEIS